MYKKIFFTILFYVLFENIRGGVIENELVIEGFSDLYFCFLNRPNSYCDKVEKIMINDYPNYKENCLNENLKVVSQTYDPQIDKAENAYSYLKPMSDSVDNSFAYSQNSSTICKPFRRFLFF